MKKAVWTIVLFAFILSLGVSSSIMLADEVIAGPYDACVDVEGVIYVRTSTTCWTDKYEEGHIYLIYDGRTYTTQRPCDLIGSVCLSDQKRPAYPNIP